jgi:phosphoenolpyruvate carboxykinase (ATP)
MRNLEAHGIHPQGDVHWDMPTAILYEHTLSQGLGFMAHRGPLVVDTTPYTGRSPKDKFLVVEESTKDEIWWGDVNHPMEPEVFDALYGRVTDYLSSRPNLYVQDSYAGADPAYRLPVRTITESPWHALFARNMFILPRRFTISDEIEPFMPEFSIVHAPFFQGDPERDGIRSEVFICVSFEKKILLIGGTKYAGEVKKSVFSVMNYILPKRGVMPGHCSINVGPDGSSAIFFGLSGTGKTTLSTDPERPMIGDDEHGWSDEGVFNIEGGSYAKLIHLSREDEPLIYEASRMFESILENVEVHPETRFPDYDDGTKTANIRVSYPLAHLGDHVITSGMAGHPTNLFFLSADAFGVLPPIARLTPEQGMYYFIAGYTAKVAGTERGVNEPQATFSPCFGAPFLPLPPAVYAEMLGKKIQQHPAPIWMVNTGWTGGPYGVGSRIRIKHSRAMIHAAINGELDGVEFRTDPFFGFEVPTEVPGVPTEMLDPRRTWEDKAAFDVQAKKLADMFREHIGQYEDTLTPEILAAGPQA